MAGEARRQRLRALLKRAGATGADPAAFDEAFVHESAVRERLAPRSNERLEFLGDAILGAVVARSLVERYPDAAEGELALRKASLVSDQALAQTAERLDFEPLLVLGAGHASEAPARRRSALSDAFEAFLAALERACGGEVVAAFVAREHIAVREGSGAPLDDPKTVLQEWTQRHGYGLPQYAERFEGPDHERTFHADVRAGKAVATGSGPSKKAAQRAAAARALEALAEDYDDVAPRPLSSAAPATPAPVVSSQAARTAKGRRSEQTPSSPASKARRP